MSSKRVTAGWLALAGAALALGAPQASKTGPPASPPGPQPPLVRRDLLTKGQGDIPAPLRDIFRPKTAAGPAAAPVFRPVAKKPVAAPAAPAAPAFSLNLTFNGSVELAGKVMGLVTVGGQTISVAVGDEVAPGYRVLRIAPDSIDVEGPNALRKTFYRQGAQP